METYQSTFELIQKGSIDEALKLLLLLQEQLKEMSNLLNISDFEQLVVEYTLLLNKDFLVIDELIDLQKKIQLLSNQVVIKKASNKLEISLKYLENGQEELAKFFLWSSFYELQESFSDKSKSLPIEILENLLEQIKKVHHLTNLAQLTEDVENNRAVFDLLSNLTNKIIKMANEFIERVLTYEITQYRKVSDQVNLQCQKNPWDQVIPMFEKGYQSLSEANKALNKTPMELFSALSFQKTTIKYWTQALSILQSGLSSNALHTTQKDQDMQEIFRSLQEMEAADNLKKQPSSKEKHTW